MLYCPVYVPAHSRIPVLKQSNSRLNSPCFTRIAKTVNTADVIVGVIVGVTADARILRVFSE